MNIVVTGGAGFIGSHVVDAYIRAGHRVAVIDNLKTGFRKNINRRARFYKADVRSRNAMEEILKKEQPEIVNHHAAAVSVVESVRNPQATMETNALGTTNLLIAFGKHGEKKRRRFVFASTSGAMYAKPSRIPISDNEPPSPISPYALSKLLAEQTVMFFSREYRFPYTILRYANVYGPRQNPDGEGGVVAIFAKLIHSGKRPTIFGDGTKTRDYVYVEDIVAANKLALERGADAVFNLGLGKEVKDQEIFDRIASALNFRKPPIYGPLRRGELLRVSINARRARRVLGWRPAIALREGIRLALQTT